MSETVHTIDWQDWRQAAFDRARRENRPVLLSLAAPWCEHCRRMDRTTYASAEVADLVRERFVPVRVNTDRRPDINDRYNLGGWPTTAFLTPGGVPFGGGTFIEAERMPGVLREVADAFVHRRTEIDALASPDVERATPRDVGPVLDSIDPVEWLLARLVDEFDDEEGGFGRGVKFPYTPALTLMLERYGETRDARLGQILTASLDRLGHLVDPVEGGFFRYAANRDWTGTRTEKILQDNAQLIRIHLDAGAVLGRPDYHDRALQAVNWVRRVLNISGSGGFAASQAADAGYYQSELDSRRSAARPAVDVSCYADANADMIVALLRVAESTGDESLAALGLDALEHLVLEGYGPGGGVAHLVAPESDVRGLLVDQLMVVQALLLAQTMTAQLPYSMLAAELMEYAIQAMWDEAMGGFRDRAAEAPETAVGLLADPLRPFAANCTAAQLLSRLAVVTSRTSYRDRAERTLDGLGAAYRDDPLLGACYGTAVLEVRGGRLPRGWSLAPVDWKLV